MKLCVIPARGGSKRIKNKNIKFFVQKEIIYYSIKAALNSKLFDKIIVSTDSKAIAKIAEKYGAEVPFVRPANISDDQTATIPVIKHAIKFYESQNILIDDVCCIYATAPFIQSTDIKETFKILKSHKWDYVFVATKYNHPIYRSFKKDKNAGTKMLYTNQFNSRSQDLEDIYHDAGQFYWGTADAWKKNTKIFSKNSTFKTIPSWRVNDIDTIDDWKRAEFMFQILNNKNRVK